MRNVWWILRRDLGAYLRSPMGYIIIAIVLAANGLLFNIWAVGSGSARSEEVLSRFFWHASGINAVACIFLSMRLLAEEKQLGTITLLATSPVKDYQLVLGKFLSGLSFVGLMTALTIYMPLLIYINGRVSLAHLAAGYLGLMLLSGAVMAIGLFCSALAPNQLVALILGAFTVLLFWLFWLISKVASPPVEDVIAYLSLHDKHFRPFMRGVVSVQDVVFYISLSYVALLASVRVLESRRWQ